MSQHTLRQKRRVLYVPAPVKRRGLAEIARVLKPRGHLVIADFTHKKERAGQALHFHAGFERVETEEMPPARFSAFPGAGFIRASKHEEGCVQTVVLDPDWMVHEEQ